jgi:lipopolysaccharide/colanic/teichoic acid biosynthesis glycosyltransferase
VSGVVGACEIRAGVPQYHVQSRETRRHRPATRAVRRCARRRREKGTPMLSLATDIPDNAVAIVVISLSMLVAIIAIAIGAPTSACVKNRKQREQTKREIAAYVAEGSITPEEGTRMIAAAEKGQSRG